MPPLDAVDRLPHRNPGVTATVWWLGVHGGAGETTLAGLLAGSEAAGHHWPAVLEPAAPKPAVLEPAELSPVVLVCRSHARGLHAAQAALTDWASGAVHGVDLLGLVIVADAPGAMPRPLRDLARLVGGGAPRVWHLPWVEALRYTLPPTTPATGPATSPAPATPAAPAPSVPAAARGLLRDVTRLTSTTPQTASPAVSTREDT